MIKVLEGFPESVIAVTAHGRVTSRDYSDLLIPRISSVLKLYGKIRLYYELGVTFAGLEPGAVWQDFRTGIEHLSYWERVAVVTDVDWILLAVGAFRILMPGTIRVFHMAQAPEARRWIA
jgi:hypothetical protein